jgi:apolipoprotein N-acyltransferase
LVALGTGAALYALALPPFDWAPFGWLALVPLVLIVRGRSPAWALGYGALYGLLSAWAVGPWMAQAWVRFFGMSWPLAFLVASGYGLATWGATFGIFAAGASVLLRREGTWIGHLTLPALWVGAEFVRARIIGHPWGLLGYTQHAQLGLIQIAALTGVYGVSFLVALGNVVIAEAIRASRGCSVRAIARSLLVPTAVVLTLWCLGFAVAERGPAGGFAARPVAIVQTNVPPAYQWTRAYSERQLLAHLRATEELSQTVHPALIVWPEHAVTRYLESEPMLAARLGALATSRGADLLFGVPRFEGGHTYNSIRLITSGGRNGGYYDKQRLLPFAEANPLSTPANTAPSNDPHVFTSGDGPGVLRSFVNLGLSICFEITYPELVNRSVQAGAELLVNVSNDGWLDAGNGVAGRQHFAMAVFRAVETRRYLVRATTTGVSGFVDPYGRVLQTLGPRTAGVLTASVAGRGTITPYVRFGDTFAVVCLAVAAASIFGRRAALAGRRFRLASAPSALGGR